jgi:hypothetical protein
MSSSLAAPLIVPNDPLTAVGSCRAVLFSTTSSAAPLQAKTLIDGRNLGSGRHENSGAKRKTSRLNYLAAGLALSLLASCAKKAPPPPAAVAVDTATATVQSVPIIGDWVATTDGYVNAQIQPQVSGYLIRRDYNEGGTVRKGRCFSKSTQGSWRLWSSGREGTHVRKSHTILKK